MKRPGPFRSLMGNVGLSMARAAGASSPPPRYAQVAMAQRLFSPAANLPYAIAYQISPDVYACVGLISETIASLELEIFLTDGTKTRKLERASKNAIDIWRRANPEQTDFEMLEAYISNREVFGAGYLLKERFRKSGGNDSTVPGELWPICSAFMTPIAGEGRTIERFRYFNGGREENYLPQDIVWNRSWSSDDNLEGQSPLSVLRLTYHTKENASRFLDEMWRRGGGMQGMFSTKMQLNEDQEKAFLERLRARFRDITRWFEPQFYPAELDWHPMQSTLKDMDFVQIAELGTKEICKAFRVPADLIGVDKSGALNSASVESSMLLFVENGIKPRLTRLERIFDERLLPDFRIPLRSNEWAYCKFNTSTLLAVVKSYLEKVKALTEAAGGPFILRAEAREKSGDRELEIPELKELVAPGGGVSAPAVGAAGNDPAGASGTPSPSPSGSTTPPWQPARARFSRDGMSDAAELQTERAEHRGAGIWRLVLDAQRDRVFEVFEGLTFPAPTVRARRMEISEIEQLVAVIDDASERDHVETFLKRLTEATGQSAIDLVSSSHPALVEALAFDVEALAVRRFLKEHLARAINVPNETTKRMLRMSIGEAWQEGASRAEMRNRIQDVFEVRRGNVGTISRTEILPALNFGAQEGYAQTGLVDELEWATARDELVRGNQPRDEFSHVAMNGRTRKLGDLWEVPRRAGGFESLRIPGDPQGSPANIINCRCRELPVIRGSRGGTRSAGVTWWYGRERSFNPRRNGHPAPVEA